MENVSENTINKSSEFGLGEFNINDYPENLRDNSFYFYEYDKPNGEWIEIGELICVIRIGEKNTVARISASKSGVLEHTLKKDDLLSKGKIVYKLHPKGEFQNENLIENSEYREYFKSSDYSYLFDKWLVKDGSYVKIDEPIFQFNDFNSYVRQKQINYSKKAGFIFQIDPCKIAFLKKNELMYIIRNSDEQRISERYINIPNLIIDEFTNSRIINWNTISSRHGRNEGIKTKSDDSTTDFVFTLNYIDNNDYIIFHFNPKQIKPRQFDKVLFLFENGEQIQFELLENPISSKNKLNERILEYKSLITKTELDLFSNTNFMKWKISLVNDKKDILGGEIGGDDFYSSKNNIQIVIKKFAYEYIEFVKKNIPNYKPTELRQAIAIKEITTDFCFVYLMHDTSNNYYKIGISNKPEYREKTLQSEKPTIEIIISKKFPIRKIAESIEKALHDTYSEKRLRGEWFELDLKDIEHIIETLK